MALTRVTTGGIAPGVKITFDQENNPSSPAITFEGASGTGIYSPADKTLSFATNGVERLKIGPNGEVTLGTVTNPVYIPITDSTGTPTSPPTGKTLYVNCNDSKADDTLSNNGENLNRPFKSIERALIEAGRRSYVPGTGSVAGQAGADRFEFFTIILYPGQYEVDNRPGVFQGSYNTASPSESWQGDYSSQITTDALTAGDFYKFNAANGGIILPRGTSIVGMDLRKTVIRPKYVPDADTGTEGAIFRLTGGCYIWQITIKDSNNQPFYNQVQQYANADRSHHKLVGFKFASVGDLAAYYRKIDHLDNTIPGPGVPNSVYELFQRIEETRIVGDSNNAATIDSVASASPYVFNCSLRSVWGMCGMHADGADVTGFRSMVVAQYTGIGLQKDDRAFYLNGVATGNINNNDSRHTNPSATYRKTWRHFHIKASNSAVIQIVSVFAVGFADHFIADSGGDLSITNSNSNFGNTSLRAIGFQDGIFPQNNKGKITAIIPPKGINPANSDNIDDVSLGFVNTQKTLGVANQSQTTGTGLNKDNPNFKIIFLGAPIKRRDITEIRVNDGTETTPDYKRYLVFGNSYQYTLGKKLSNLIGVERIYLDIPQGDASNLRQEPVRLTSSSHDPNYNQYGNEERVGYGWVPSTTGTVTDDTEGLIYIKITYAPTATSYATGDAGLLNATSGIFKQLAFTTSTSTINPLTGQPTIISTTSYSYEYFYGLIKQPYLTRLDDSRGVTGGGDLLWRLEYQISKNELNAKTPERRFLLYPYNYTNGQGGFNKSLYIYQVEIAQDYKYGVQDGVYYLTVLKGDVSALTTSVNGSSTADYPVSQNINYLYPTINQDDPVWNPVAATSKVLVEGSGPNAKSKDIAVNYVDSSNPSLYPYTTPDLYSITREAIADYLAAFPSIGLPPGVTLATPYGADTNANAKGKEAAVPGRKIALTNAQYVSLKRSSIIRASSHTWEYLGYGPGNYSTGFPSVQTKVLDRYDTINSQGIEHSGGFVASTGTNSQGEFYIGNQIIRSGSDDTETLNVPKVKYSSETRLIDYTDMSNQLTNSLIVNTTLLLQEQFGSQISGLQTQLQSQIAGLANNFISSKITASESLTSLAETKLSGKLVILINEMSNTGTKNFPEASATGYGFVKKATSVTTTSDSAGYITPSDLEQWRISKGIQTTTGTATALNFIFIQPPVTTTLSASINADTTSISVASTDGFEPNGLIELEYQDPNNTQNVLSECIYYTGITPNSFTGCIRGSTDPRTLAATTKVSHAQGTVVVLANRYWWEEPYQTGGSSNVQYKAPRKVDSYTSSDIDYYINNNFTPNPKSAKEYGVKLQQAGTNTIGTAVKQFKPFARLDQAAAWAFKNGFGANDTVFLKMKPGYYFIGSDFHSRIEIDGATLDNGDNSGVLGSYQINDGRFNQSVFLYRGISVGLDYAPYDNAMLFHANGTMTLRKGGSLSKVHILSMDETLVRNGVPSSDFDPARITIKNNSAIGDRFTKYIAQIGLNHRAFYLSNPGGTLTQNITATSTIAYITNNYSAYSNFPRTGSLRIGASGGEVINYSVLDYNDPIGIKIQITARAVDAASPNATAAAAAAAGTNVYYYYCNNFVTTGNKLRFGSSTPMGNLINCNGGSFHLNEVTVGASNSGHYGSMFAGGVYQGGTFRCTDCAVHVRGLRLRGNEHWKWSTYFNYNSYEIGHSIILFDMAGSCKWSAGGGPRTSENIPQTDPFYVTYPSFNYSTSGNNIHLEPTTLANGTDVIGVDGRMHGTAIASNISTTANTITIGSTTLNSNVAIAAAAFPSSGKALIAGIETISYTGKTDNGNGTHTLTGVSRNLNAWRGTVGTGGAWYGGTDIAPADFNSLDTFDKTNKVWTAVQDGFTAPVGTDVDNWKFRGPSIRYMMGNRNGLELRQDQYSVWAAWSQGSFTASQGFQGKFSTMTYGGRSNTFNNFTTQFDWYPENQYYTSFYRIAGILDPETAPNGLSGVTLASAINATQDTITLAGSYDKISGGVISINTEMMEIIQINDASFKVVRGHLRTIPAAASSGTAVSGSLDGSGAITKIWWPNLGIIVNNIASGTDFQANTKCSTRRSI